MNLNVRVSGSVWSSLIFDNVRQQGDKEGFLIGEISMQEMTNISDSQINKTVRETTVNVISHTICPKPFSFYNRLGQVDRDKLEALLKSNCENVVGWFRCRSGSIPEPSLRENAIHHHLRDLLGAHHQTFLFGIFGEGTNLNHTTITNYYNFYTYTNGLFTPQRVAIENLGDTAQSEYKHGSSLNTESSGSDSYRDILTSHKKDMIDKDGYLQGMQGIKMTNEAIHEKMKTLKDSVVKSEDSVQRLVTEIKMLSQKINQSQLILQRENEQKKEPVVMAMGEHLSDKPQEDIKMEVTSVNEQSDNIKVDSEAPPPVSAADSDPFSSLIIDMKASISSPSKPRSNSDQMRKGSRENELLKAEERKVRSSSGSEVPKTSLLQTDKPSSVEHRNGTEDEEPLENDLTQLPDSPTMLESSGSQTF